MTSMTARPPRTQRGQGIFKQWNGFWRGERFGLRKPCHVPIIAAVQTDLVSGRDVPLREASMIVRARKVRCFAAPAFALLFVPVALSPMAWGQAPAIQWIRQFGTGAPLSDTAFAVDSDGNTYVAGNVGGALPGQSSLGNGDAFIRKYDTDGNEVWTRQFGTGSYDDVRGISADSSGIYVTGDTQGSWPGQTSAGGADVFVRKYDAGGNVVW